MPAYPGEVVIRTYSTNQIEVYWGDGSHLPGFQRYTVAIEPQGGSTPAVDTVLRHATFSNLNPGDLYIIAVTVDADDTLMNTVPQRTSESEKILTLILFNFVWFIDSVRCVSGM